MLCMIGCIVQARLDSSRLPGKVLLEIENKKSVLFFVIEQLKKCSLLDEIVVATSDKPKDDDISKFCEKNEIKCFRGNDKNVLDRYYQCAKKFNCFIFSSNKKVILFLKNLIFLKLSEFQQTSH